MPDLALGVGRSPTFGPTGEPEGRPVTRRAWSRTPARGPPGTSPGGSRETGLQVQELGTKLRISESHADQDDDVWDSEDRRIFEFETDLDPNEMVLITKMLATRGS